MLEIIQGVRDLNNSSTIMLGVIIFVFTVWLAKKVAVLKYTKLASLLVGVSIITGVGTVILLVDNNDDKEKYQDGGMLIEEPDADNSENIKKDTDLVNSKVDSINLENLVGSDKVASADKQILSWNNKIAEWEIITISGVSETNTDTQELTISGHTLSLVNGGSIVIPDENTTYKAGTGIDLDGKTFELDSEINDLSDVDTETTPATDQVLTWNGSNWVAATSEAGGTGSNAAIDITVTDAGGYYTGTNVEEIIENIGANVNSRWSTGIVSGGGLTDIGGSNIDIASGEGFINNGTDEPIEINWNTLSGISMLFNGDNYIYIDSTGSAHITNTEDDANQYISLGYVYTVQSNTDIGLVSSNPYLAGNYTNRNNAWIDKAMGPIVESGNIVSEHTTNLEIATEAGVIHSRLSEYDTVSSTDITKWFNTADYGWYQDPSDPNPNKVDPSVYNNTAQNHSSALVSLQIGYWKKDLLLRTLDGEVHYIYATREYDTEAEAKEAPLPEIPEAISKASAIYLATVVSQESDTTVASRIYDLRPNMNRIFGSGASGTTGSSANHGNLTGLAEDDHTQYLLTNGGRTLTGSLLMGYNNIVGAGDITMGGTFQNLSNIAPQMKAGYDTSNYYTTSVAATGVTTFDATGTAPEFIFADNITNAGNLTTTGTTALNGITALNGNTTIGDAATDQLVVNAILQGANVLSFEGTTNDLFKTTLAVEDPTANRTLTLPNTTGTLLVQAAALTEGSVAFTDFEGRISEDNANFFWDDTNNRLGLGITSPEQRLHVKDTGGGNNTPLAIFESDESQDAIIEFRGDTSGTEFFIGRQDYSDEDVFSIGRSGTGYDLTVNNLGNVGINDATPDALLDVAGSFRLDGTFGDKDGDVGIVGQILSSTASGTDWVSQYITSTDSALSITGQQLSTLFDNSTIGINGSNQLYTLNSGINTAQLADNSITNIKLAVNLIDSDNYIDDSIDNEHINWGTGANQIYAGLIPVQDSENYYTQSNVETVLQQLGLNANKRWSTGLIEGGVITDNGDNDINISAGSGFINNTSNKLKEVTWSIITDEDMPNDGDNFIYIDIDGNVHIAGVNGNTDDYIYLGYVYTVSTNTDIGMISSNPYYAGNYENRNNNMVDKVIGTMVESGNIVSEHTTDLELSINSGTIHSRLAEYNTSNTNSFTKWYDNNGTWTQDTSNLNTVSTSQYNDTSSGLTNLSVSYWKKDLVLRTLDGNVHYIYGQSEHATEDSAKEAALPTLPSTISNAGSAYLATIVSQQGDTSIENRLYDVRPNMSRVFGFGTNGTVGSASDHGTLTGLGDDDHTQYLLGSGARAMTGSLDMGGNSIANINNVTMAGLIINNSVTTPQTQVGYDASNYFTTAIASDGYVTFDSFGSNQGFKFNDPLTLTSSFAVQGNSFSDTSITLGDAVTDQITINAVLQGASPLVFEGVINDSFETTLAVENPTVDRIITLPNTTGTLLTQATALTLGSVSFADSEGRVAEDNTNFFWDNGNSRLGVGTNSPTHTLQVDGQIRTTTIVSDSGTQLLPAYSFNLDIDTGIFNSTTNELGFTTAGSEALRIDNAGRVGINDTTPDALLDVAGSFRLDGTFGDKDGNVGISGQILSSTATGTDWITSYAPTAGVSVNSTLRWDGSAWVESSILQNNNVNLTITGDFLAGTVSSDLGSIAQGWDNIYTDLTQGSIVFLGSSNQLMEDDINFFWDDINNRLGIGTNSPDEELHIADDMRLDGSFEDKDGDTGTIGQVLSSTVSGTNWVTNSSEPTPFISTDENRYVEPSTTKTFTLEGKNFTPTTAVAITNPAFTGTIDTVNVLSPTEMEVTVTTPVTEGTHDIVLSNGGVLNTSWTGNGTDLFSVNASTWKDLRSGGYVFTHGNAAGNDIRYRSGMSMIRDANGMYFTGASTWSSWVKFESLGWTRGSSKTAQWIFTTPSGAMMIGIGSDATNEDNTSQYSQAEVEAYFSSSTSFARLYGNDGTVGTAVSQSNIASISGCISGVFKVKFEDDGDAGDQFTLYCLPSANPTDWNDEAVVIKTFAIGGLINPDESNIMPFIIPRDGGAQRFIGVKVE